MDVPNYTSSGSIYWGDSPLSSYRTKGPSWIRSNGAVVFEGNQFLPGLSNRKIGPSIINSNGQIEYMRHGVNHRVDGPAVVYSDSSKEYWVDGIKLTQLEFFATYGAM